MVVVVAMVSMGGAGHKWGVLAVGVHSEGVCGDLVGRVRYVDGCLPGDGGYGYV